MGTIDKDKLITPAGVEEGDTIFLTKEIAIETVSILSNDFPNSLREHLTELELSEAQSYHYEPGISIYEEATLIRDGFDVTAMHDPTEGGLSAALWELSIASNKILIIYPGKVPISELTKKVCNHFSINPINSISSGALLFTAKAKRTKDILNIMGKNNIQVSVIGYVSGDGTGVINHTQSGQFPMQRPERDEITKVF